VTAAPRVSRRCSGGAVDSDLFGDTPPAAPTNASAAAWRQDLLWGESNSDVTVMVPLLPFRLVLLDVQSYGGRFRGERGGRSHPPPTDDDHVVGGGTELLLCVVVVVVVVVIDDGDDRTTT